MLLLTAPPASVPHAEVFAALDGDLDADGVGPLRNSVFSLLDPVPDRLVLDVSRVRRISRSGVRTLVALRRKCTSAGVRFVLRSPSLPVRRELQVDRLTPFFEIEA